MAPKISFLDELTAEKAGWRIKVRIIRLWEQDAYKKPGETNSLHMLFIDEKGGKMHGTVKKQWIRKFQRSLSEGDVYVVYDFGVTENTSRFKMVPHRYKINFYPNTVLEPVSSTFLAPRYGFAFTSFADILGSKVDVNLAVDVIGQVVAFGDVNTTLKEGRTVKRVSFELEDLDGLRLSCTVWDAFADYFSKSLVGMDPHQHMVVVIQLGRVNDWEGTISVMNCFFGTCLLINCESDECSFFTSSLLSEKGPTISIPRVTNSRLGGEIDPLHIFTSNCKIRTINEVQIAKEPFNAVVFGTIVYLQKDHEWYYIACRKCNKAVETTTPANENDIWYCSKCDKKGVDVVQRFKIRVRVQDATGSVTFVIFERDIYNILKKTALDLLEENTLDSDDVPYPNSLDILVGMNFVFKISVDTFNIRNKTHVYTVRHMTNDSIIMEKLKEKGPTKEDDTSVVSTLKVGDLGPETPKKGPHDKRALPINLSAADVKPSSSKRKLSLSDDEE